MCEKLKFWRRNLIKRLGQIASLKEILQYINKDYNILINDASHKNFLSKIIGKRIFGYTPVRGVASKKNLGESVTVGEGTPAGHYSTHGARGKSLYL